MPKNVVRKCLLRLGRRVVLTGQWSATERDERFRSHCQKKSPTCTLGSHFILEGSDSLFKRLCHTHPSKNIAVGDRKDHVSDRQGKKRERIRHFREFFSLGLENAGPERSDSYRGDAMSHGRLWAHDSFGPTVVPMQRDVTPFFPESAELRLEVMMPDRVY